MFGSLNQIPLCFVVREAVHPAIFVFILSSSPLAKYLMNRLHRNIILDLPFKSVTTRIDCAGKFT